MRRLEVHGPAGYAAQPSQASGEDRGPAGQGNRSDLVKTLFQVPMREEAVRPDFQAFGITRK